jgi:hypothetical protein
VVLLIVAAGGLTAVVVAIVCLAVFRALPARVAPVSFQAGPPLHGADLQAWTAVDDHQLTRLLKDSSP